MTQQTPEAGRVALNYRNYAYPPCTWDGETIPTLLVVLPRPGLTILFVRITGS